MQERLRITSCGLMLDPELPVIPVLQDDSRYHVAVFEKACHMHVLLSEMSVSVIRGGRWFQ